MVRVAAAGAASPAVAAACVEHKYMHMMLRLEAPHKPASRRLAGARPGPMPGRVTQRSGGMSHTRLLLPLRRLNAGGDTQMLETNATLLCCTDRVRDHRWLPLRCGPGRRWSPRRHTRGRTLWPRRDWKHVLRQARLFKAATMQANPNTLAQVDATVRGRHATNVCSLPRSRTSSWAPFKLTAGVGVGVGAVSR